MDKILLYNMERDENSKRLIPDEKYKLDKDFLERKFLILFDDIKAETEKTIKRNNKMNIIDILYDEVKTACYGYSLGALVDGGYKTYKHQDLCISKESLKSCEEQIKLRCFLSSYYTLIYLKDKTYLPLIEVAKRNCSKKYYALNEQGELIPNKFYGYSNSDTQSANKIRASFDRLHETYRGKEDLWDVWCIKEIIEAQYKKEKKREIRNFLQDFTFDLIVNNMADGFDVDGRYNALKRNQQSKEVFRRNAKKFAQGLYLVENNFLPSYDINENENSIESSLYYLKRESVFHTILLNRALVNSDKWVWNNLSALINFPIVPDIAPFWDLFQHVNDNNRDEKFLISYLTDVTFTVHELSFFISLCEVFDYDINEILVALRENLNSQDIQFVLPDASFNYEKVERETATIFGDSILETFMQLKIYPVLDHAFWTNVGIVDLDDSYLWCIKTDIGLDYFDKILN